MNLVNLLKDQVTGALAGQAAKFLGESESGVTKALDGAFPAILGKVIDMASDQKGAKSIFEIASKSDTGMLDNIGDLFGSTSKVTDLMNSGGGVLSMLLGNNMGGFIEKLAGLGGIKSGSASSLIKMAAPFLMSMLGRHIKNKALDAVGLGKFLGTQKSSVAGALPGVLGNVLGLGSSFLGGASDAGKKVVSGVSDSGKKMVEGATGAAGNVVRGAGNVAEGAVDVGKKAGGSLLKWLLPLFLVLLALGWLAKQGCNTGIDALDDAAAKTVNATEGVASGAVDATKNVAEGAKDMAGDAANAVGNLFGNVNEAAKAALDKISFAAGSVGDQMTKYIAGGFKGDGKFQFKNLNFASGSATIAGTSGSEVDNLAAILKAYEDVKISVDGYTDSDGNADANLRLSQSRADAVKARLLVQGIAADRIMTKGHGAADPVASNDTAEGKAQNRRIEVTISK
jgi:outer membrane protein OmpA-like peptidoglycan-associated protein